MESTILARSSIGPVLDSLRVSGAILSLAHLEAPFTVDSGAISFGVFHAVLAGSAWVRRGDDPAQRLGPGHIVIFPTGASHLITDTPEATAPPVPVSASGDGPVPTMAVRNGGDETRILCGTIAFDDSPILSMADALPAMVVAGGGPDGAPVDAAVMMLAEELGSSAPGSDLVATRLVDVLVIRALRQGLAAGDFEPGWAAGLRDPGIGRALGAIHAEPDRPWTASGLASIAAMSRSGFYARFTEVVGVPPATYLARWRIHRACGLLRNSSAPVAEVGRRVGFRSPAAFTTAFKRLVGSSPLQYRRAA
jgi:AraC-like DNA-binding protein